MNVAAGHALPGQFPGEPLAEAVRAVGRPEFPVALAVLARAGFAADQTIVFQADADGRLSTLVARNLRDGDSRAEALAHRYARHHSDRDPWRPLLLAPADGRTVTLRSLLADEIADADYRRRLFVEPGLSSKAAIIARTPERALYINLYRSVDRGPFTDREMLGLGSMSEVIAALVERHASLAAPLRASAAPCSADAVERALAREAAERGLPALSKRESETCARILLGQSTEAVALSLGVSLHTAATYRRRAFAKLGIAGQKELFAVVLRHRDRLDA